MIVYRLEDSPNELPKHWAYGEVWESSEDGFVDNRQHGFQVWGDLHRVVSVASGAGFADGVYGSEDYPYLLVVEASEIRDGAGEWFAVRCEDVESVRSVNIVDCLEWAKAEWIADIENGYDYEDDFEAWCEDSEEEISQWLLQNATRVSPKFVETLENPYLLTAK